MASKTVNERNIQSGDVSDFHSIATEFPVPVSWANERTRLLSRDISFLENSTHIVTKLMDESEHDVQSRTTRLIDTCRTKVTQPYTFFLKMIGWMPFMESSGSHPECYKWINVAYPICIVALIMFGCLIQWASGYCQFMTDAGYPVIPDVNDNTSTLLIMPTMKPAWKLQTCKDYFFSRFLVMNTLHLFCYVYSCYILRLKDHEHLISMMTESFLFWMKDIDSTDSEENQNVNKFWSNFRPIFIFGVAWILLQLALDIIHAVYQFDDLHFSWLEVKHKPGDPGDPIDSRIVLTILMLGSFFFINIVYVAVVVNYMVQCRLLNLYIENLIAHITQRSASLSLYEALKKCNKAYSHTEKMNEQSAIAVTLVMFDFISGTIMGIKVILTQPPYDMQNASENMLYGTTAASVVLWLSLIAAPVYMASLVSSRFASLRAIGNKDLDAVLPAADVESTERIGSATQTNKQLIQVDFFNYMANFKMSAKLFFVPVNGGWVLLGTILMSLVFLTLMQFGIVQLH